MLQHRNSVAQDYNIMISPYGIPGFNSTRS